MRAPGHSRRAGLRVAIVTGLALTFGALAPGEAAAQQGSPVLTLDQEELFQSTIFGKRMQRELNEARTELITENARIQETLEVEETRLTEQRAELAPAKFRELADAFDEKVTSIRAEQEGKTRALQRRQERAQQVFFRAIAPVVQEVVRESGAVVILDKRAIILSSRDIDVTDAVRARVDALLGDGGTITGLEDDPEATEEPVPFVDSPEMGVPVEGDPVVPPGSD